jgi:hypothetical protein
MKGTVYGGILYLPAHPFADIHYLVRAVMRTKSILYVNQALEALGIDSPGALWRAHLWAESSSAIEKLVTESHYGAMMVCPLVSAYLKAELYQELGKEYFGMVITQHRG